MDSTKIEFYNALKQEQKYILNVAALYASDFDAYRLRNVLSSTTPYTLALIQKTIDLGLKANFITQENKNSYKCASPDFMVYIYPSIKDYTQEIKLIDDSFRFHWQPKGLRVFSKFLRALLFEERSTAQEEEELLIKGEIQQILDALWSIFENSNYQKHLSKLSSQLVNALMNYKMRESYSKLEPFKEIIPLLQRIKPHLNPEIQSSLPSPFGMITILEGNFSETIKLFENTNPAIAAQLLAANHLLHNRVDEAYLLFEKGIKSERVNYKNRQIPTQVELSIFYLIALAQQPAEKSLPIYTKICTSLEKKPLFNLDLNLRAICHYALNQKQALNSVVDYINNSQHDTLPNIDHLVNSIVFYLTEQIPTKTQNSDSILAVQKAYQNGYLLMAYEAAFALLKWCNDATLTNIFDQLAAKFQYQPAISQISFLENWEQALNGLLDASAGTKQVKSSATDESKARIIYYVDPLENIIQPVLQTRSKTGWSTGRNVALKTFNAGNVEGMTEQDYRIAKQVQRYSGGYYGSDVYEFKESAIKELVGHPHLYLNTSRNIQMELVEGQPTLEVIKSTKGYLLKSDISHIPNNNLIVEKETNTRYKLYSLKPSQRAILNAILQNNTPIPEKGKDKLMKVLAQISSHITVHSDLIVTENRDIKRVEADSRIRVQLLPLGDGLKAELFTKPFGTHPPYCKPGLGGKTLIYNDKGDNSQVVRDLKLELINANELMVKIQTLESFEFTDGLISFEDPLDALNMLDIIAKFNESCVVEWPEGEKLKIIGSAGFGQLKFNIKSKASWFDLQGELRVNESTVLSIQELLLLNSKSKNRFIELENGAFLALTEQLKKQLNELNTFTTQGKEGLQINKFAAMALTDLFEEVKEFKSDKAWKEFRERIKKADQLEINIPTQLQADLRPYQEEGFRWLARLAQWEAGACLADDMGLGKTVQTLATLLHRASLGPALVVCPVSVVPNWINEAAKFTPTLTIKTLTSGNREQILNNLEANDLLITSYGILQSEEKALTDIKFATIILDEAHAIKNFTTKTSKAAMQLQAPFRIALTGTPIQNHLGEMWNLFNFINPGLLGNQTHFVDTYIKADNEYSRKHLKKLISPFILRRLKSNVLDELPPKTEIIKKIELSKQESAYYEALRRQAIMNMESDESTQGTKHLKALAEITRLRQACCNIALVDKTTTIESSKLATFLEIADGLIENKHRALVFSQFVTHLALVEEALKKRGINYQYLDGQTSMSEREARVKKFQSGEGDLFLISLKAGGLGINLTAADYVIHLDPWWNPAIEDQASDRAHRYGQSKPVTIYRLVTENTIEEKIIELHNTKRDLADSLLEGSDQSAKLSVTELMNLIKEKG